MEHDGGRQCGWCELACLARLGSRCNEERREIDWRRDLRMQVSAFTVLGLSVPEWRDAELGGECETVCLGGGLVALLLCVML